MRTGLFFGIPRTKAISSAVRKPMPSTDSDSMYGFSFIRATAFAPSVLCTRIASCAPMLNFAKNTTIPCTDCSSAKESAIFRARFGEMPLISVSRSGDLSIISSVCAPKCATRFFAVCAPTPEIVPEER